MQTPKREGKNSQNSAENTPQSGTPGSGSGNRRYRVDRMKKQKIEEKTKTESETIQVKSKSKKVENATPREQPKQKNINSKPNIDSSTSRPKSAEEGITKVVFNVPYVTVPKQDLYLAGDSSQFGAWQTDVIGIPMKWTEDHLWTVSVDKASLPAKSTYKFVCREKDGSLTWEGGENRAFDLEKISYSLTTSHRLKSKGSTSIEKGSVELQHNSKKGIVTLNHTWRYE